MKYETILNLVSKTMNVSVKDMKSKSRKQSFCDARRMHVVLCVEAGRTQDFNGKHFTLEDCAKSLSNDTVKQRTHCTVINLRTTGYNLIDCDPLFRKTYKKLAYKMLDYSKKKEIEDIREMIEVHATNENGLWVMSENDMDGLINDILNR